MHIMCCCGGWVGGAGGDYAHDLLLLSAPLVSNSHPLAHLHTLPCSLGTLESTKAAYECVLDVRIATPQIVLNYAALMQEHKFFEEAFRCAEVAGR